MRPSDYIKQLGWTKRYSTLEEQGEIVAYSLEGAIVAYEEATVAPDLRGNYAPDELLRESVSRQIQGANFTNWNNAKGRTRAEVIAALEMAEEEVWGPSK